MSAVHHRRAALALLLGLAFGLGGCETGDLVDKVQETVHDFNPFGSGKKKLSGTRRPVFPEGVPGVQQGVPPDLLVGAQPAADATPATPARLTEEVKPKPASRRRAMATAPARREARRPAEPAVEPEEEPPPRTRPAARRPAQSPTPAPARGQQEAIWPEPGAPPAPAARPAPAPAQAARPAPAAAQPQTNWQTPASQPVPTIWPDPPAAR